MLVQNQFYVATTPILMQGQTASTTLVNSQNCIIELRVKRIIINNLSCKSSIEVALLKNSEYSTHSQFVRGVSNYFGSNEPSRAKLYYCVNYINNLCDELVFTRRIVEPLSTEVIEIPDDGLVLPMNSSLGLFLQTLNSYDINTSITVMWYESKK